MDRAGLKGRSIGGDVVFDTGELPKLFPELRVVRYEEPMATSDFGRYPEEEFFADMALENRDTVAWPA